MLSEELMLDIGTSEEECVFFTDRAAVWMQLTLLSSTEV